MKQFLWAGLVFGLAGAGPAAGQVSPALLACVGEVKDSDRLKCYDEAVKGLSAEARTAAAAREKEAAAAAAAATVAAAAASADAARAAEETRKDSFGKAADADERIEQVEASIGEILQDAAKRSIYVLDNGQIWRQADGYGLTTVKAGSSVVIKRGAFGSYRLFPKGSSRYVQVIRMR